MDNREAIEWLKGCVVSYEVDNKGRPNGNVTCDLTQEVIDMAISALEKQIPKRKLEKDQYNEKLFGLRCPSCGERVGNYNGRLNTFSHMALINYCPKCGQAIDFSKPQREEQDG
jgi:rRNA maturation protein Nop10